MDFPRIKRLPPYVFNVVGDLKLAARRAGEDIIDLVDGQPRRTDAAAHRRRSWSRRRRSRRTTATRCRAASTSCASRSATGTSAATASSSIPTREAIVTIGSKEGIGHLALAHARPGRRRLLPEPDLSDPSVLGDHRRRRPALDAAHAGRRLPRRAAGGRAHHLAEAEAADPELPRTTRPPRWSTSAFFERHRRVRARARAARGARPRLRRHLLRRLRGAVASCRCRARRTSASSSSRSRRATTCRAGASASRSATARSSPRSRASRATSTTASSSRSRSRRSHALNGPQHYVDEIRETLPRSGATCSATGSSASAGTCRKPKATMFVWARDSRTRSSRWARSSSRSSSCARRKVAVSPGIGFGEYGDDYVRFALIENEHRTRQAVRGIRKALGGDARRRARAARRPADRARAVAARRPRRADRLRHDRHRRGEAAARAPRRDRAARRARRSRSSRIADLDTDDATAASPSKPASGSTRDARARARRSRRSTIVIELIGGYEPARRFVLRGDPRAARTSSPPTRRCSRCTARRSSPRPSARGVRLGFEASVGGGIPILRTLKEGLAGDRTTAVLRHRQRHLQPHPHHDDARGPAASTTCCARRSGSGSPRPIPPPTSTASTRRTSSRC